MLYLFRFCLNGINFLATGIVILSLSACVNVKPATLPPDLTGVIKSYQRVIVHAYRPPWTGSNIYLNPGDRILILASGRVITWKKPEGPKYKLGIKIGRHVNLGKPGYPHWALGSSGRFNFFRSTDKGELKFCVKDWDFRNIRTLIYGGTKTTRDTSK
jgi:hypothetical protein